MKDLLAALVIIWQIIRSLIKLIFIKIRMQPKIIKYVVAAIGAAYLAFLNIKYL